MKHLDLSKLLMLLFELCLFFLLFKCENEILDESNPKNQKSDWKCNNMDTALLRFSTTQFTDQEHQVLYQYETCNKCNLIPLKSFEPDLKKPIKYLMLLQTRIILTNSKLFSKLICIITQTKQLFVRNLSLKILVNAGSI